jgi:hypothetical protein
MAKRVDENSSAIVSAIRSVGAEWISTSGDPTIGFDGLVLWRGHVLICEIKDGSKPPSQRRLTENERKRQAQCESRGIAYLILTSPDHAVDLICSIGR